MAALAGSCAPEPTSATPNAPKATARPGPGRSPAPSPAAAPAPEVAAWVLPYADSLASLDRSAPWLTLVSPAFYRLRIDAKEARLSDWDPNVPFPRARLAHVAVRAPIVPLVGCIGACGPKISRILEDERARRAHVADLVATAVRDGVAGLFVDYEDVDATERSVRSFVSDLAFALHAAGKKLGLVVQEPCGAAPACHREPFPFALGALVDSVDWLAVMEYDFSIDASAPPAPRDWVTRGLTRVAADVGDPQKLRKVLCGIPFYGRVSPGIADDTAVLYTDVAPGRVRSSKVTIGRLTFDARALSKIAAVSAGPKLGTLYLEDRETLAARLAIASELGVGGIAIWRLGGEDPCNVQELARFRRTPPPPCRP